MTMEQFEKAQKDKLNYKSSLSFSQFKLNKDGLIPVIVQDYKTDEVLMNLLILQLRQDA